MEYPRSWYPLCRSHELKCGSVIAVVALGHRLAVFRTQSGELGAINAQCCHIGADLSRGWVEGERLLCPLHLWAFDTQGKCRDIPCEDTVPDRMRQDSLHCQERYGVVYGYLGEEVAFPLPSYNGIERGVFSKPRILDFDAPYEMAGANSFDEQHLATVHRRHVINGQSISSNSPAHFAIEYRARVTPHTVYDRLLHLLGKKEVHMRLDCWGGNLLLFSHIGTKNRMIISLLPTGVKQTRAFITTVIPKSQKKVLWPLQYITATLLNRFTMMFVQQDVKALQGIDFKFINVLPESDATMVNWYKYWKQLPRTKFGCRKGGSDVGNK